jgi:hypothetical protein
MRANGAQRECNPWRISDVGGKIKRVFFFKPPLERRYVPVWDTSRLEIATEN